MKSYAFLFWGDVIVWTGLTVYVVVLLRKAAGLARRLDALEGGNRKGNSSAT